MKKPEISVILRTYNEAKYLERLLKGIKSQVTTFSIEVILIDSGSTDNTIEIAKKYSCKILTIKKSEFTFGKSLNIGCKSAQGKYLVIISGHCIPCGKKWIENLVNPLHKNIVSYTYGRQIGDDSTNFSEERIFLKHFPKKSKIPQEGFFCNNANSAILKVVWEKYSFDESLTGLEDLHLAKRIKNDGNLIGYVGNAIVYHIHNETWQQIFRRFKREAIAMKIICPELELKKRNFIQYFLFSYFQDLFAAIKEKKDLRKIIFLSLFYRFNQYLGSYIGHREIWNKASKLRDIYYYSNKKDEDMQNISL